MFHRVTNVIKVYIISIRFELNIPFLRMGDVKHVNDKQKVTNFKEGVSN